MLCEGLEQPWLPRDECVDEQNDIYRFTLKYFDSSLPPPRPLKSGEK